MELSTKIKDAVKELNKLLEQAEQEGLKLNVSVKRDVGAAKYGCIFPVYVPVLNAPQVVITMTTEL